MAGLVERQQEEGLGQGRLRRGRAATLSLGLIAAFLVLGFLALRTLDLLPRQSSGRALTRELEAPRGLTWHGTGEFAGGTLEAWLAPLHEEPSLQRFRAQSLRTRYELPAGEPWRLWLALRGGSELALSELTLLVAGAALPPLGELAHGATATDPLRTLLSACPKRLEPDADTALALWGTLEEDARPELVLAAGEARVRIVLTRDPALELARSFAALAPPPRREAAEPDLAAEVERLRGELEVERGRRIERELAFQAFQQELENLESLRDRLLGSPALSAAPVAPTPEELAAEEAARVARVRAEELARALSVRMKLEGLRGLDLLECGSLLPGAPGVPGAIGPVVFRVLDERGRLTGSLSAARLRLEASLAARTLTLVLEEGFESQGGERVPFEGGTRRITLGDVDPEPWFEEFPELFQGPEAGRVDDDGRWRLADVRRELNRLFALDTHERWYRLHSLGGVRDTRLNQVLLEELEPGGRVRRRFFADTLELALEDASLVLTLRGGALVLGEEKQPFRDGVYRIVVPGVAAEAWRAAALPGLRAPPEAEKTQADDAGAR